MRDRTAPPSRTTGPEAPHRPGQDTPHRPAQDTSVGDLIGEVAGDLTRLVRNEIDLAKAEVKEEGRKAGKAAALFGGAGYAVGLALLLASFAAVYGLAHVIGNAWAALVVAAVWAVAGAVLQAAGRKRMGTVQPTPERSRESLREDVKWARHPTS
ncbi:phage holin family protein [Streptomyces sp. Ru73]|uniref:phage holin family protein n=1 Tax=Streptomyces sp. Ru73 TaxID=2080748 RepID=UPI0021561D40|nr:phage holin family protein [Streptomyces sp. Ru73]